LSASVAANAGELKKRAEHRERIRAVASNDLWSLMGRSLSCRGALGAG
jgi:hypothetical protein